MFLKVLEAVTVSNISGRVKDISNVWSRILERAITIGFLNWI